MKLDTPPFKHVWFSNHKILSALRLCLGFGGLFNAGVMLAKVRQSLTQGVFTALQVVSQRAAIMAVGLLFTHELDGLRNVAKNFFGSIRALLHIFKGADRHSAAGYSSFPSRQWVPAEIQTIARS
jgi:hypothetical protein